jgi:hypothetical protein
MARMSFYRGPDDFHQHRDKLILQCHLCSGLMIGFKCHGHHYEHCHFAHNLSKCWEPENYRPVLQNDGSINFLAKWIDCKCEGQRKLSSCSSVSEMILAYRVLKWARLTFLLACRRRWERTLKLTSKHALVGPEMLDKVLRFLS